MSDFNPGDVVEYTGKIGMVRKAHKLKLLVQTKSKYWPDNKYWSCVELGTEGAIKFTMKEDFISSRYVVVENVK